MPEFESADLNALRALFAEVNTLAGRLRRSAARNRMDTNLPPAERSILKILKREGPRTVPQIAQIRFTSRQNIQILINALASKRMVELVGNPAHKRSALVRLTELGTEVETKDVLEEAASLSRLAKEIARVRIESATEVLAELQRLLGVASPENVNGDAQQRVKRASARGPSKHAGLTPARKVQPRKRSASAPAEALSSSQEPESGELPVSLL